MTIHEIVQKTGLTKKAINYYEKKGLITPEHNPENSYRTFSDQELKRLAVIALLRQLEIPVEKIRLVLDDKISLNDLLKQRLLTIDTDVESLKSEQEIVGSFLKSHEIAQLDTMEPEDVLNLKRDVEFNQFKRQNVIRAQWQKIFPGSLGRLFSLIYSAHLSEPVDTPEKREAWAAFVEHLDQIEEIDMPDGIKRILDSEIFATHMHDLENNYSAAILHFGSLDKKLIEEELPAPPPTDIDELPPEKVELVRGLLRISAFVRDELGERLEPLKKYLTVLSSSYGQALQNLSLMNDALHQRSEYQPFLDMFNRLRNEARSR
jgi:DNA-binding transcriptional MerR regulator